jgi:hypothetical protein
MVQNVDRSAIRRAFGHIEQLETALLARYPDTWRALDAMRADPPSPFPDWCLLPMAAAAALVANRPSVVPAASSAHISALYAWRYSRAVYIFEPNLLDRLLHTVHENLTLDMFVDLPNWAVYIPMMGPESHDVGVCAHLEYDVNVDRPELRLLFNSGSSGQNSVIHRHVFLDLPPINTEAHGEFPATGTASDGNGNDNAAADAAAGHTDRFLAAIAYLAQPDADIVELGRERVHPGKRRRTPAQQRTTWLVGYHIP